MTIPGFIDLQVNGCVGVDYSSLDLTEEDFIRSCRALWEKGTIGFLPTIVTSSEEVYRRNLPLIRKAVEKDELAQKMVIGFHLEGPFISPEDGARGAHPLSEVQMPNIELLQKLIDWSGEQLRLFTIAAELPGAEEICAYAVQKGIAISLGHQLAQYETIQKLVDRGATGLTHLGNANPHWVDRHRNSIISGLASDELTAMFIPDGHHIPDEFIKLILLTRSSDKLIVVSDASPFAAMPPGEYSSLGLDIKLDESGKLYNPVEGYLVGSSSTMLECMNYLASLELVPPSELLDMCFRNPLRFIGIDPERYTKYSELNFSDNRFTVSGKT